MLAVDEQTVAFSTIFSDFVGVLGATPKMDAWLRDLIGKKPHLPRATAFLQDTLPFIMEAVEATVEICLGADQEELLDEAYCDKLMKRRPFVAKRHWMQVLNLNRDLAVETLMQEPHGSGDWGASQGQRRSTVVFAGLPAFVRCGVGGACV